MYITTTKQIDRIISSAICILTIQHSASFTLHSLDIDFPMYSYGGIGALYNDLLFGLNGHNCSSSFLTSCSADKESTALLLDLSSLQILDDTLSLTNSPSWNALQIQTASISTLNALSFGSPTTTTLHGFTYLIYPDEVLKYDLLSNKLNHSGTFILGPPLIDSCSTNDGTSHLYLIGGRSSNESDESIDAGSGFGSSKSYKLHISSDDGMRIWEEMGNLTIPRYSTSCLVIRDRLYVLGGISNEEELDSIELYTSDTAEWRESNMTLSIPRSGHISVLHPNGWIVTIGGTATFIEVWDPWDSSTGNTESVVITDIDYQRMEFFHAVHEYDAERSIVFLFGGYFNESVYDDIRYLVMSKDDKYEDVDGDSTDSMDETVTLFNSTTTSVVIDVVNDIETTDHELNANQSSVIEPGSGSNDNNSTKDANTDLQDDYTDQILDPTMQPHHEVIIEGIQVLTIVIIIAMVLLCICIGLLVFMIFQRRKSQHRNSRLCSPKIKEPPIIHRVRVQSEDHHQMEGIEDPVPLLNGRKEMVYSEGMKAETHQLIANGNVRVSVEEEKEDDLSVDIEESSNESIYGSGDEEEEAIRMNTNGTTTTAVASYSQHQYAPVPLGRMSHDNDVIEE